MVKKATSHPIVLILGAGASKELGFPLGTELKQLIAKVLSVGQHDCLVDDQIEAAFALCEQEIKEATPSSLLKAAAKVKRAMPLAPSIDNFINSHQGNRLIETVSKIAIARVIINAERESFLMRSNASFIAIESTWYVQAFKWLAEDCRLDELQERFSCIEVINFNYDRSFRQFLVKAIEAYYHVSHDEALQLSGHVREFRPYGSVGSLVEDRSGKVIEYGATVSQTKLVEIAGHLRTFAEGTDPESSEIGRMRQAVRDAGVLLFLGFGYHPLNIKLLEAGESVSRRPRILGTSLGLSEHDIIRLKKSLGRVGSEVELFDVKCCEVFWELRLFLASELRSLSHQVRSGG